MFDLKLSLMERRTFHTAIQVFKILNKISLPYLHGIFCCAMEVSGCVGRNPLKKFNTIIINILGLAISRILLF